MCSPEDPLFTPLLQFASVPFEAKQSVHKTPLRKFGNFSLYSLNFHPNFSSQAPKFGNFQLTSLQIWKFSVHKPPFSEANISSQAPHFGNPGRTPLPEKKSWVPPLPGWSVWMTYCPLKGYWTRGVLELFFEGVCGARSENPTHIQGFFSLKKWLNRQFFSKFFQKMRPISKSFSTSKMADFTIFSQILWNGILLSGFFWPKWDPCLRIFCEKVTPNSGGTSPYALACKHPPPYWTLNFIIITPHFPQNTDTVSHVGLCSSC